jgi:high-affinity Fe2+/Pb2+ permease
MLGAFTIVLREGFESFLLVAVILSYLRKAELKWLSAAVYVAIGLAVAASRAWVTCSGTVRSPSY